jgi:hypothetical protein
MPTTDYLFLVVRINLAACIPVVECIAGYLQVEVAAGPVRVLEWIIKCIVNVYSRIKGVDHVTTFYSSSILFSFYALTGLQAYCSPGPLCEVLCVCFPHPLRIPSPEFTQPGNLGAA